MLERLHKVLARAGVAALRPAEDMIMAGRVTVNGRVVRELGARVDAATDVIAVDGQLVEIRQPSDPNRYVLVHKPVGIISTAHDTHDRPTVVGLVPSDDRLFPVGRLDADSEGLILLTNDGDLAYRLTHPRFEVEKEYRVLLDRTPSVEDLRTWREGVELEGEMTMPAWVEVLERTADGTWIRVVMREGRKRQIREIARILGYDVLRLIRVREGPIHLADLPPGQWRDLTPAEVQMLRAHTQHIPSRAADEEAERRMADRDQSGGRRLRVIRGLRRPALNEQAPSPQEPGATTEPSEPREQQHIRADEPTEFAGDNREQPARTSDRERPRTEQRPNTYNTDRSRSTDQRRPQGGFNRSDTPDRRPARDDRFREGGNRERSGGGYDNRSGPRRDAGPGNRGFGERSDRGYGEQRGYSDRSSRSQGSSQRGGSYGNPSDYRDRRDYGQGQGSDRGSYNRRPDNDRGNYNRRPDNDRGYGPRADNDRGNYNRRPDDERRGYGSRPDNDRGNYNRRPDNDRGYGPRADNDRGNYNRRPDGPGGRSAGGSSERRSFGDAPRDRGPRRPDERSGGSFDPQQRDRDQAFDSEERWNRSERSGPPSRPRSGGPGGERREGGFGGAGRSRTPARPGGRPGGNQSRSGGGANRSGGPSRSSGGPYRGGPSRSSGGPARGGPSRSGGSSRPQRPGMRGSRKGRNNG